MGNRFMYLMLFGLLVLALSLNASVTAQAGALHEDGNPPPPPTWWQQLWQRWFGPRPTPAPTTMPAAPSMPTIAVRSLEQLEALPQQLPAGRRVQVYITADDLDSLIAVYLSSPAAKRNGLLGGEVTLAQGEVSAVGRVSRDMLEAEGVPLWFVRGDEVEVSGSGRLRAANCRLVVELRRVRLNGMALPAGVLNTLINDALVKEWPSSLCLESVTITSERVIAIGYRR